MSVKLSKQLRGKQGDSDIAPTFREYEHRFRPHERADSKDAESDFRESSDLYYDLATDFYELGWGRSFHFAPVFQERASGRRSHVTSTTWPTC